MYDPEAMQLCLDLIGPERVLWSMDYPYVKRQDSRDFLASMHLSDQDLAMISQANAERLFKV
ncbi:amidohydrolase family protein [Aerococcus urinaehominis]|uniref:amidohydrolase family protein n=1 Tax=Aerococcus urinaehominis TaxID=128944 RepID=UPI000944ACEE|nr:amidohydrolase family protein [Aerococcus urinaehominis]